MDDILYNFMSKYAVFLAPLIFGFFMLAYGPYMSSWAGWRKRSVHPCGYVDIHGFTSSGSICPRCGEGGGWKLKVGRQGIFQNWIWKD